MRIRDWSSDVCSSDLSLTLAFVGAPRQQNDKGYCQEKRGSRNCTAGAQAIDVGYACHASSFKEFAQETNRLGDVAVGTGARAHGLVRAAKGRRPHLMETLTSAILLAAAQTLSTKSGLWTESIPDAPLGRDGWSCGSEVSLKQFI